MVHASGQKEDHGEQGPFIHPFPDIKDHGQKVGQDHKGSQGQHKAVGKKALIRQGLDGLLSQHGPCKALNEKPW